MIEWIDIIWSDLASQFFNPKKRLFFVGSVSPMSFRI